MVCNSDILSLPGLLSNWMEAKAHFCKNNTNSVTNCSAFWWQQHKYQSQAVGNTFSWFGEIQLNKIEIFHIFSYFLMFHISCLSLFAHILDNFEVADYLYGLTNVPTTTPGTIFFKSKPNILQLDKCSRTKNKKNIHNLFIAHVFPNCPYGKSILKILHVSYISKSLYI